MDAMFSTAILSPSWNCRYSLSQKIDICRGLFSFLVVTAHALELALVLDPHSMEQVHPWIYSFLKHGAGNGLYYVMGFFVISGYCIQCSVVRLSTNTTFPLRTYLMARLTRILP